MQAIQFSQHGGPEVLQVVELSTPQPAAGQILVKVAAAGVNYADVLQRLGTYPMPVALPAVVGYEVAGTVAALSEGVTHLAVGQRVMALLDKGGYAGYAVATAAQAFPLPDGLGDGEALALLVQGLTAVGLLETGQYKSVLMLAAAGGVGSILVQVAKNRGIRVVAAVGSEAKKATVLALGADAAVSYADADWVAQVRAATDEQGVDAVFDAVGGAVGTAASEALNLTGTSVIFGAASGEPTTLNGQQLMSGRQARGYFIFADAPRLGDYAQELFSYLQAGRLQLAVTTYPAAEVQQAQRDLEARRTQGKVALLF